MFCILFVVPPQKLPPALQAVDALGPLIAAVLIAWLPLHGRAARPGDARPPARGHRRAILIMAHLLIRIVAFFGVLMMTAPAAYEEAMAMFKKGGGAPPAAGGGYPPPGGGYPPPGGGYPPPKVVVATRRKAEATRRRVAVAIRRKVAAAAGSTRDNGPSAGRSRFRATIDRCANAASSSRSAC